MSDDWLRDIHRDIAKMLEGEQEKGPRQDIDPELERILQPAVIELYATIVETPRGKAMQVYLVDITKREEARAHDLFSYIPDPTGLRYELPTGDVASLPRNWQDDLDKALTQYKNYIGKPEARDREYFSRMIREPTSRDFLRLVTE